MSGAANWPDRGERCILRVAGTGDELACVVDEVREDRLVLVPAVPEGSGLSGVSRAAAFVEWMSRRGRVVVPATVVGEERRARTAAIVVEAAGDPDVIQRRGHVRAITDLQVEIDTGRGTRRGLVEDLSGGGLRVRVDGPPLERGTTVSLEIPLQDDWIEADARVAELYGPTRYGLEFVAIEEPDRDRLIRHVFERLRIEARLGEV